MNETIFLIDTNSFITPYHNYYPFDIAPTFWDFLKVHIENGNIAVMSKVYDEVAKGNDELKEWLLSLSFAQVSHSTSDVTNIYRQVMDHIQNAVSLEGKSLYNERALYKWADINCADAIVAAAKAKGYTIISFEQPDNALGSSISGKPRIPDVAKAFGVPYSTLFSMMRTLGFSFK
ncbi:MAG: DUF4411 family protein [Eubacteriaceae bacterium]|nr:DUF4411 family protein [Eubacteriaceae bacterium]